MDQKIGAMQQPKKGMKAFWPLVIIFVIAALLGGLIYWFKFNLVNDYDLQSMVITIHRRTPKTTQTNEKKAVNATTSTSGINDTKTAK